jgi:ketosteroid isomerase-like protein
VLAWAEAWSRKDLDTYFAAYAPDFAGGTSRKAWEDERRARIAGKKSIVVKLSDLQVVVNGDKATARFRQDYAADAQKVSSRKTLDLARQGGKWVIVRESTGS